MIYQFFFLLFCVCCFAEQIDSLSIVSCENEPSALVDGKVNAITGTWIASGQDLVIQGAEPIIISRTFVDGEWSICSSISFQDVVHKDSCTIVEHTGAKIRYKSTKEKVDIENERFRKYVPVDLERGYTNTSRGVISSRTNLQNNTLFVGHKEKKIIMCRSNGSVCTYREVNHGSGKYNLLSERLPNGNWILYEYEHIGKKENKITRLHSIRTTNPSQNQVYARADLVYQDAKGKKPGYKIVGSDGQVVEYCYQKNALVDVRSSNGSDQHYGYSNVMGSLGYFSEQIQEISRPLNQTIQARFYTDKTIEVDGQKIVMDNGFREYTYNGRVCKEFVPDPRCGKIMTLSEPIGSDPTPQITYSFFYDIKNRKTSVFDVDKTKTDFFWDENYRLKEIICYALDGKLLRIEKFCWSPLGNLLCKSLVDENHNPLHAKKYSYNCFGDVIEERTFGNLSGKGSPLVLDSENCPIENGVESYGKRFTYIRPGSISLLASVEEDDGHRREYTYLSETDLITSQKIFFKQQLQEEKFWQYDTNLLLIQEITKTKVATFIKNIIPLTSGPYFGLPWIKEEKYVEGDQEILLSKTVLSYTTGARIAQKDLYDANNTFLYSLKFKYDEKGRLIEEVDAIGRTEQFGYDACGRKILHKHSDGRKVATFEYDFSNCLIRSQQTGDDGILLQEQYAYDRKKRCINENKPLGHLVHCTYDSAGFLSQKQIHDVGTFLFQYDSWGRSTIEVNPDGFTTKTAYNARHQPICIEHPDGGKEEFIYYLNGLLKRHINQEGVETDYTYNCQGQPLSTIKSRDGIILWEESHEYVGPYVIGKIDAEKNKTSFEYDRAGRLLSTCCAGEITTFEYDSLGREILEKKGDLIKRKEYDFSCRVIAERKEGDGKVLYSERYEYDSMNNLTSYLRGEIKEERIYDSLGRCIERIDSLGRSTRVVYENTPVLRETTIDPLGLKTIKCYNSLQKVTFVKIVSADGKVLSDQKYTYDFRGNILEKTSETPRFISQKYSYDSMGRMIEKNEGGGKTTKYEYDRIGHLTKVVKPDGTQLEYNYGSLGELISLFSSDRTVQYVYSYDRLGRQLSATDLKTNQTTEKKYDAQGRVLKETLATGFSLINDYNSLGYKVQCTLPDSSSICYVYDPLYIRQIVRHHANGSYTHRFESYDQSGHLLEEKLADDLGSVQYSYNGVGQKEAVLAPYFTHEIIKRDAVGNILEHKIQNRIEEFSYDNLYQIASEKQHTYVTDAHYCRLQKDEEIYQINDLLQVSSHLNYDQNGNPTDHESAHFIYDALNRLTEVELPNKRIVYTYDSDHRRLAKTVFEGRESATVYFLYDGQKEIGTIDPKGIIQELRILNPMLPSEMSAAISIEMDNKVFVPVHDLFGNVRILINSQGVSSYDYSAFGEEDERNDHSNPWRYASKRVDEETGFSCFGRRYYLPALGCFLTPDPAESEDNLYAFVKNNPLLNIDLFGLYTTDRAADTHYFDRNYASNNNFSIGTQGDGSRGTINYHCGINNSREDVELAQNLLYALFDRNYGVEAHWIHNHNIAHGLSLVAAEKLSKRRVFAALMPTLSSLGNLYVASSYLKEVIEYEKKLIIDNAEQIIAQNNPRLKQLHILFSNASFPFREILQSLSPPQRDTVIVIPVGPTTLIEKDLAHRVFNVIGHKDWPSRACNGLFKRFVSNKNVKVEFIQQSETKLGVFGHYFNQLEYQNHIKDIYDKAIENVYEIY